MTYFAIIGRRGNVIGACTDRSDVLREEPHAKFVRMTKKMYDEFLGNKQGAVISKIEELIEERGYES